jgi:hypothetical protein
MNAQSFRAANTARDLIRSLVAYEDNLHDPTPFVRSLASLGMTGQ